MTNEPSLRLNKHLALTLGVSRREADNLIDAGDVTINETVATLGARFHASDTIRVRGKAITHTTAHQYVLFHKPVDYVCSRKQQGDSPTIYSLLPQKLHALKPVGRLDRDSSGVLLLTNDGDLAFQMTHPKFRKVKLYEVTLDHDLAPLHQQMIADYGVQLDDGTSQFQLERLDEQTRTKWRITMSEGRNRQIRRTFDALGYTVTALHRTHFGPYSLGDMKAGEYKITNIH